MNDRYRQKIIDKLEYYLFTNDKQIIKSLICDLKNDNI